MDEKPIWETESGLIYNEVSYTPDSSVAQYTGGLVKVLRVYISNGYNIIQ